MSSWKFRKDLDKKDVLDGKRMSYIAEELELTKEHVMNILNKKSKCPKPTAMCLARILDKDKKVEDFFEKVEKERK